MATSLDPTTVATQLATAYTMPTQSLIDAQSKTAQSAASGLSALQSALSSFKTALGALSSKPGQGLTQYSATASDSSILTATATNKAQPASTPLFVEQIATTHQVAFQDLPAVPAGPGALTVRLANGGSFNVDLVSADTDGDNTLSQAEIARAINASSSGQATAMIVTVGSQTQLMMTSGVSGAGGEITLDTSALSGPLKTALDDPAKKKVLVGAQDAVVWLGAQGTGVRLQQASNTVTAIDGVTIQLTKAQAAGSSPVTLNVARDDTATTAKLQSFIDAYNKLETTLDSLTKLGANGATPGAFASDAGVRSLKDGLANLLRQSFGGGTLRDLGVTIARDGSLSLSADKLNTALKANPQALDQVLGSASLSASSGALGALSSLSDTWSNPLSGQIQKRQTSVQAQQKALSDRQTRLDNQYSQAYDRYLKQFTVLQQLQSRMSDTGSLFDSLSIST